MDSHLSEGDPFAIKLEMHIIIIVIIEYNVE